MQIVTIVGAGNLGKAMAAVFAKRADIVVRMWDKDPSKVAGQKDLAATLDGSRFVFLCLPSWVFEDALADVYRAFPPDAIAIAMAKGVEAKKARRVDEMLRERFAAAERWALMSGPMLAAEMAEGHPGIGVIAAADAATREAVAGLFDGTVLRTEATDDTTGVALCGVLKNVYAMGLGITEALDWEGNARGWYVAQATREMAAIVGAAGGRTETVLGPSGLGDLVATGFSQHSRNRAFGHDLVRNGSCPIDSEGCASLAHLLTRLGERERALPILAAVTAVVIAKQDARSTFSLLI